MRRGVSAVAPTRKGNRERVREIREEVRERVNKVLS